MITITLQTNNSQDNKVEKALTKVKEMTNCILKENTSMLTPTVLVSGLTAEDIGKINYMTIPAFNRSYFVTDMVSVANGVWEISGRVDVLHSYSAKIKSMSGIVARQEMIYNLYLEDDRFPIETKPHIVQKAFPNGFTQTEYILVVAGS